MPNIAEMIDIFETFDSNPEQAILIRGGHGIGKSELVTQYYTAKGYEVIVLFLGQTSDVGDIIGLPRFVEGINSDGSKYTYTDFAPPKWWPVDFSKKYVIFLDEINRGKPEAGQCVMDLVLNRRLNGRDLPPDTRIIAGMNPIEDEKYQVEEMDPAYLSRFNVYDLRPSCDEWIRHAQTKNVHPAIIEFINKNPKFLDPPTNIDEFKPDEIYPNRRSWFRFSKLLNSDDGLIGKHVKIQNVLIGMVGAPAASAFLTFVKTYRNDLTAGKILVDWNDDIAKKVKNNSIQENTAMNSSIGIWIREKYIEDLKPNDKFASKVYNNLQKYLEHVQTEACGHFFNEIFGRDFELFKKESILNLEWPKHATKLNVNLGNNFISMMHK